MNNIDLITIIGNISQSLGSVQRLVTGMAYLLGVLCFIKAISILRKIGDYRPQSPAREKMFTPISYIVIGAVLIYIPTSMSTLANSVFGAGNVLTYGDYNPYNIYSSMGLLIRTAGVIWFVRGSVLLMHASEPGTKEGPKGLLFVIAGIFAMNFDSTIAAVNYILTQLISWTLSVKSSQGY